MPSQDERTFIKTLPGLPRRRATGVRRLQRLLNSSIGICLERCVRRGCRFRGIRRRVPLRGLLLLFLIWYLNINVGRRRRARSFVRKGQFDALGAHRRRPGVGPGALDFYWGCLGVEVAGELDVGRARDEVRRRGGRGGVHFCFVCGSLGRAGRSLASAAAGVRRWRPRRRL